MDKEAQILKLELRKDEGSQTFTMRKLLHGLKTDATSPMLQAKQKLSQGQRFFFFFLNFWVYVLGFGFEPNFRDEKVAPWFENWWNRCHLADAPSKAETFSTTKFFFFFLNFWVYVLGFGFVFLFKTLRFQFTLFLVFKSVFIFFYLVKINKLIFLI